MSETLLIIEDEQLLGTELVRHFRHAAWEVVWVRSFREARRHLFDHALDPLVVLSDINLPDGNGLDLLDEVRQHGGSGEWVLLTGYGEVPDSVRAMRLGAFDFLTKPCEQDHLDLVINGAARGARAQRRLQDESAHRARRNLPDSFVGHSDPTRHVRELLTKLTQVPFSTLIITGETGTGKGLAARIIHHGGPRAAGPLVEINCAALPHGGTIFLDEIGELPVDLQAKLLKVIEDRCLRRLGGEREIRVDVQVLAASNQNIEEQIHNGSFRTDLYHRLSLFKLGLPPLRERIADIRDLVPLFVAEFNAIASKKVSEIPDEVWRRLENYRWPGNVRELRNVVERCVLFATDQRFPVDWLQLGSAVPAAGAEEGGTVEDGRLCLPLDGSMGLDDMVGRIIEVMLQQNGNNVTETSRVLKTTREKVRYRIEKYNIKVSD
jgi:two-component system response regulator AtoC